MTRLLRLVVLFSLLSWVAAPSVAAEEALSFREQLERANELIKSYRHFEACEALQEATKLAGDRHPSLHMRLAILYYGLGFITEAIAEGEKAVALSPSAKWYKYDLAKFYYVDKQYTKAEQQFVALLTQDPGFTLGYYYLAELYFRNKDYDMAWLSLQRARLLGHQGKGLEARLEPQSKKPREDFSALPAGTMVFRYIKVGSEQEAKNILAEILKGKLFENFELEVKKEKGSEIVFGVMSLDEVKDPLAAMLQKQQPFAAPTVITIGSDSRIVQRIAPFNPETWRTIAASPTRRVNELKLSPPSKQPTLVALAPPSPIGLPEPQPLQEKERLALQLEAYYSLESWKNAWKSADVGSYLAAYSSDFIPADKIPLATWKNKRITSLTKPKYIRLKIENPVIEFHPNNYLMITFIQHFASDSYSDSVRKSLIMVREKDRWKIREERTLEILEQ